MMVRKGFYIVQIIVLSMMVSCSDSENTSDQKSLQETQDKIAQEAADYINVPLDKAKQASELANRHVERIKEAETQE